MSCLPVLSGPCPVFLLLDCGGQPLALVLDAAALDTRDVGLPRRPYTEASNKYN